MGSCRQCKYNKTNSVRDGSGQYIIPGVPFGEYNLIVSQTAGVTDTSACEVTQFIVIPEIEPLVFNGDLSYTIDECSEEVTISADVTGGIQYAGGGYLYNWTLTTNTTPVKIIPFILKQL